MGIEITWTEAEEKRRVKALIIIFSENVDWDRNIEKRLSEFLAIYRFWIWEIAFSISLNFERNY